MRKAVITISIVICGFVSLFSQDLEPPLNLDLYADRFDVYLFWEAPNTTLQVLDYNIYKNGIFLDNTNDTSFIDNVEYCSEISYYITAVYENGESLPSEIKVINISYCWIEQIFDDMENYSIGEQIACQNNLDWTTWSNLPCSEEDAFVTDEVAYSDNSSICVEEGTDLVYPINNYTYGVYTIRFYMYIPVGYDAYFNTLQEFEPIPSWGMQVYFDVGGVGSIDAGGASAATFSFPYNTWFLNEIYIDLESDWAQYSINNEEIHEWVWSLGTFGQVGPCQLGGSNFFAYAGGSGQSKCFIDDYLFGAPTTCIPQPPSNLEVLVANNDASFNWTAPGGNCELLGFNIYKDDINIAYTTDIFFHEFNLTPGEYEYYITAVYNNFEAFSSDTLTVEIGSSTLFFDNFDSYTAGELLVSENPLEWIILDGAPGPMSPEVTDTFSFSGPNSIIFDIADNVIKPIDNYDTGIYSISFRLYIPDNKLAAFTTFSYFDEEYFEFGMQVNFYEWGQGSVFGGEFTGIPFNFSYDTWLFNEIIIDLNNDWAAYYLNGEIIHSWVWSSGAFGGGGPKKLGGSDFYAYYSGGNAVPEFFLDDYCLVKLDSISFFDDFEDHDAGEQLVCQSPENWTTWNNMPCTNEDPFVTDTFAFNGTNSVLILDSNNLVHPLDNYTTGKYKISFYMYIPIGERGVFSVLKLFDGDNSEVGVRVNFDSDGYIYIEEGNLSEPGIYNPGTWMKNEIIIDLDEDWAEYYMNDVLFSSWQWSLGIVPNNLYQLAGVNFKADFWTIENAKYFIDDYMFVELFQPCLDPPLNVTYSIVNPGEVLVEWDAPNCPDLLGYKVYFEGAMITFTTNTSYLIMPAPGTYEMCITAVYETGESDCAWITIIITGMEENDNRIVIISPNPTKEIVRIESKKVIKEIKLYDLNGSLKMEINGIVKTNFIFSIEELNPGVYILLLETETEVLHKRLIIQ